MTYNKQAFAEMLHQRQEGRMADDQQVRALVEAMDQLLDDMGKDGTCVSPLSKAQARIAFEPFRDPDNNFYMSLDRAKRIVAQTNAAR